MIDCLIVTSTSLRHKYFALKILKAIPNSRVIFEHRDRINYYKVEYVGLLKTHFDNLFVTEENYFKEIVEKENYFIKSKTIKYIDKGDLNSDNFYSVLKEFEPKCIALYSVSIIRDKLISTYSNRLFNVHAGLSPYYRGTATNIWPIINNEPEYIGMTIHHVNHGIDSGGLIIQGRPELEVNDNTHTMACKNTSLAADLMIKCIQKYCINEELPNVQQDLSKGKQYYFKDFNINTVKQLNKLLNDGIIRDYIEKQKKIKYLEW